MPSTKSLFEICISFICDNLHCLDSLNGFPESVGRKIFFAAFPSTESWPHNLTQDSAPYHFRNNLKVFFEAYGAVDILVGLSLQENPQFVNDTVDDCWWLYQYLSHLDLAYCGLGDSHDILSQLLGSTYRLKTLILKGNSLTDEGLRRITLRSRMFSEMVLPLETLDLSENTGVTPKSLQFLKCCTKLTVIDASDTSIFRKDLARHGFSTHWRIISTNYDSEPGCNYVRSRLTVSSSGWGMLAVQQWINLLKQAKTQRKPVHCAHLGVIELPTRFYTKKGEKDVVSKSSDRSSHNDLPKTNGRKLFLVSSLGFACPHFSAMEIEKCCNSVAFAQTNSAVLSCMDKSALPHKSLQDQITGSASIGNLLKNENSGKILSDYVHKVPQKLQKSCDLNSTEVHFKEIHRGSKRTFNDLNTISSNISNSSGSVRQPEKNESIHSLVSQYKSQPGLPLRKKKSKLSLLEAFGE